MTTTTNTDAPAYMVDGVLTDGEAWVALSTTVLTGDANSVTLTSSTGANDRSQYMDLVLIINARNDYGDVANGAGYTMAARLNDDSGTNYPWERYYGAGSGSAQGQFVTSTTGAVVGYASAINDADVFNGSIARFADINSGKWKVVHSLSANATDDSSYQNIYAVGAFWKNTAAINKMQIYADTAGTYNFVADSRFDLFGVLPRMVS